MDNAGTSEYCIPVARYFQEIQYNIAGTSNFDFETRSTECKNLQQTDRNCEIRSLDLNMATSEVDDLTKKLGQTTVDSEHELSFKGKGLKLDKKDDGMHALSAPKI